MRRLLLIGAVLVGLGLLALAPTEPPVHARANDEATRPTARAPDAAPLLFGVVGFYNPRLMFLKYQPIVDYLTETTGDEWELEIYTTYEETVQDLCSGQLAAAYLGPYTYVRAHARCGAVPVVRLNTSGEPLMRSYVMVRRDSPISSIEQLRGKRFAFGSPLSTSSHLLPRDLLRESGIEMPEDVACEHFDHHDKAARAVLLGRYDACGVRDIVGDRFSVRGLRVLAWSKPTTNFPIVVSASAADTLGAKLVSVLVDLPQRNEEAARRIASWDEEIAGGFRRVSDEEYEPVRELAFRVLGPDALTMTPEQARCPAR
jgi:phosphonate transport system substrate-binding protein